VGKQTIKILNIKVIKNPEDLDYCPQQEKQLKSESDSKF
jgi:hypothetical protein